MKAVMSAAAVASRYKGVQVSTASPVQIVAMLYRGILRFVGEARSAMESDDRARAGERIGKALAIVDELAATLDPSQAPELADNLVALYGFCKRRLFEANLNRDGSALDDVVRAITPVAEAWTTLAGGAGAESMLVAEMP